MKMKSGEYWHCTNTACQCVIFVETSGTVEGQNPRCACGSVMKKRYSAPTFQYLDFLHFPEPALTPAFTKE
jgi:hypothetical protein